MSKHRPRITAPPSVRAKASPVSPDPAAITADSPLMDILLARKAVWDEICRRRAYAAFLAERDELESLPPAPDASPPTRPHED